MPNYYAALNVEVMAQQIGMDAHTNHARTHVGTHIHRTDIVITTSRSPQAGLPKTKELLLVAGKTIF